MSRFRGEELDSAQESVPHNQIKETYSTPAHVGVFWTTRLKSKQLLLGDDALSRSAAPSMADPHPEARDPGGNDAVESTGVQIQKRMTPEDFGGAVEARLVAFKV